MADKSDGSGKGTGKPPVDLQSGKRPTPIIDLKATEIAASTPDVSSRAAFADRPASATPAATPQSSSGSAVPPTNQKPAATAAATAPAAQPSAASATTTKAASTSTSTSASAASPASTSTSRAPQSPASPAPAPQRRSGGGMFSHLVAGVLGGALALLGLETFGPQLGLRAASDSGEIATRLAALEKAARASPAVPSDITQKITAAEARLARLDDIAKTVADMGQGQARLAEEQSKLGSQVGKLSATEGAGERLAALEDKLKALVEAAGNDADKSRIPQLAAITGQVRDLQTTLTNQLTALRNSVAKDVETRIGAAQEVSAAARAGTERLDKEVAAIKSEAARVGQRVEALKADGERLGGAIRVVQEDLGTLKSGIDSLKVELATGLKTTAKPQDVSSAIAPITSKLAAVEQNLQGVVKGEEERRVNAERIVLALELGNLKRALDRGGRYTSELAEVRKIAGNKVDLTALERFKDTGVPSLADLGREFRQVAFQMLEAEQEPADAGVVDKLLSGARSIVRVRRTGQAGEEKSTEAIAARMENYLKDGRLVDVIEEAKKLSPKARNAGKDWLARVEGRAGIDRAVAEIEAQLKAALSNRPAQKVN